MKLRESIHTILALTRYNIRVHLKDLYKIIDTFYWPAFDVLLWGYTTRWIENTTSTTSLTITLISSAALFHIMSKAYLDISLSLMEELWNRNIINLFAAPITLIQWSISNMLFSLVRITLLFIFLTGIVLFTYKFNLLALGWWLVPLATNSLLTGFSLGFISAGLIIYNGQRMTTFIWPLVYLIASLSGAYYSPSVLPLWVQKISALLPSTYTFKALRALTLTKENPTQDIITGLILALIYIPLSFLFFYYLFNKSKQWGLQRLEKE